MNQLYFTAYDNAARPLPHMPAGQVSFAGQNISLSKIAGGILVIMRYRIDFDRGLRISLSSISAEIGLIGTTSSLTLDLGVAVDPQCHVIDTDHEFHGGVRHTFIQSDLRLPLSLAALEAAEHFRDGSAPEFKVALHGSAFVKDKATGHYEACRLEIPDGIRFHADRDIWTQQIRNVAPLGSVLIEIPLPATRPEPWAGIWGHLDKASANLAQGGEMSWKNCVSEVRQALDTWRAIDKFHAAPSRAEKEKDKRERLYDVANALFHYCSLSVHADEHRERWARADAILALSTLCALLSARDP